jgi:hypothetical protein
MKRNARSRGPTSSEQQNDMVEEISADLTQLNLQWNERLVPLLSTLPNGEEGNLADAVDAFEDGLDGKTLFTDSDATSSSQSDYFNSSADRPYTLKEQIADIYTEIESAVENIQDQIEDAFLDASKILVIDSAGLYSAVNVEAALAEVMNKANLAIDSVTDLDPSSIGASLLPELDNTYALGSNSRRWSDAYLGPSSLNLVAKSSDPGFSADRSYQVKIDGTTGRLQILDESTVVLELDVNNSITFPSGIADTNFKGSEWDDLTDGGNATVHTHSHSILAGLNADDHPQYLLVADIDDSPVNGETDAPISSNWAYDHANGIDPHTVYLLADGSRNLIGNFTIEGQARAALGSTLTVSGTNVSTVDWDTGNSQSLDLSGAISDVGLALSNPLPGASYILKIKQDWVSPVDLVISGVVLWPEGLAPSISTGSNAIDIISFFYDGVSYYGSFSQDYQ